MKEQDFLGKLLSLNYRHFISREAGYDTVSVGPISMTDDEIKANGFVFYYPMGNIDFNHAYEEILKSDFKP
jgi:hypothetical protein